MSAPADPLRHRFIAETEQSIDRLNARYSALEAELIGLDEEIANARRLLQQLNRPNPERTPVHA